jgi:hypothetical protein
VLALPLWFRALKGAKAMVFHVLSDTPSDMPGMCVTCGLDHAWTGLRHIGIAYSLLLFGQLSRSSSYGSRTVASVCAAERVSINDAQTWHRALNHLSR